MGFCKNSDMDHEHAQFGPVELSDEHQHQLASATTDGAPNATLTDDKGSSVPVTKPYLTVVAAAILGRPNAQGEIAGRDGRRYIAVSVMTALVAQELVPADGNWDEMLPWILAGIVCLLCAAGTRSLFLTVAFGMMAVTLLGS